MIPNSSLSMALSVSPQLILWKASINSENFIENEEYMDIEDVTILLSFSFCDLKVPDFWLFT